MATGAARVSTYPPERKEKAANAARVTAYGAASRQAGRGGGVPRSLCARSRMSGSISGGVPLRADERLPSLTGRATGASDTWGVWSFERLRGINARLTSIIRHG